MSFIVGKFDHPKDAPGPVPVQTFISTEINESDPSLVDQAKSYSYPFGKGPKIRIRHEGDVYLVRFDAHPRSVLSQDVLQGLGLGDADVALAEDAVVGDDVVRLTSKVWSMLMR
jgi:hypothetical protein